MSDASGTPRTDAIVNRLGATNYDFKRDMISLARELEALTISQAAEIQRLRVDAERYRYLRRDRAESATPCVWMCNESAEPCYSLFDESLDYAIDSLLSMYRGER